MNRFACAALLLLLGASGGISGVPSPGQGVPGPGPARGKGGGGVEGNAYFILPKGNGYRSVDSSAAGGDGVPLRFADEVTLVEGSDDGETGWYLCRKQNDFFYLPEANIVRPASRGPRDDRGNLVIGREPINSGEGIPLDYEPDDLELAPQAYAAEGYEERTLLLRREAKESFVRLIEDAGREGVDIAILSAYRSARYQSYLYADALLRHGPTQNRVAKPGRSEHQLGTTCDLTTGEIGDGISPEFESTGAFAWLKENGHRYGIFLSYPKYGERITGYMYEPWHFRYYGKEKWVGYGARGGAFLAR